MGRRGPPSDPWERVLIRQHSPPLRRSSPGESPGVVARGGNSPVPKQERKEWTPPSTSAERFSPSFFLPSTAIRGRREAWSKNNSCVRADFQYIPARELLC